MSFPLQLTPTEELTPAATTRPIMFEIKDKNQLYIFYMPFLQHGGIFVPTAQCPAPGSKALALLTLPGDPAKKTVSGKVCWVTPPAAQMGVASGIGIHFDDNDGNRMLRDQIEKMLAGILGKSDARTQTM